MAKPSRRLAVVVMAAGKGKRLRSALPKVLHPVAGRAVLRHVLEAARRVRPWRIVVVVSHGKEQVEEAVRSWGLDATFVDQGDPLGTGHAVMVAEGAVGRADDVLVLPGDEPLVTAEQLRELLRIHRRRDVAAVLQTTEAAEPRGFGRVIRDGRDLVRIT
ncbi:MAG TPA: NTP transferase domain-containing protein, partial [Actinomycetota bacterium]|nr:NTP transferase domain-containing protein [Actinomycetota bacterium]